MVCENGVARVTSRIVEPDLVTSAREIYHRACYASQFEERSPAW
jgi:hypothetical protein